MSSLARDPKLQFIFGITLMVVMGVSSVVPVLPDIMAEFQLTPAQMGLFITYFTLPGVVLAPISGVLADRLGRVRVLVPSLWIFALAGAACAFAPDYHTLLLLRFVQGIGVAPLGILSVTLIGDNFTGAQLPAAMGLNMGVLSFGTAIYPAFGGIAGLWGWRAVCVLPLVALLLAWRAPGRLAEPAPKPGETLGEYLRGAAAGMKNRTVLGMFLIIFIIFLILYGPVITFYPILLGHRFSASPLEIGLIISFASLFSGLAATQLGRLSKLMPESWLMAAGAVLYGLMFYFTLRMQSLWWFLLPLGTFGLAQGLSIPSAVTLLQRVTPKEYRGATMAAHGSLLRLSQTVAPLALGGVSSLAGLNSVFWCGMVLAACLLAAVVIFLRDVPRPDKP